MNCTCGHSQVDHATGRCVNRKSYHDPAVGVVTDVCACKRYEAQPKAPVKVQEPEAEEPAIEAGVEDETETSPDTAPTSFRRRK